MWKTVWQEAVELFWLVSMIGGLSLLGVVVAAAAALGT